jgi:hypothetical protein
MEAFLELFAVIAWCTFKFFIGLFTALLVGLPFYLYFPITIGSGMLGIWFYIYVWDIIMGLWYRRFPKKSIEGIKINKRLRFIVKVVNTHKLFGIALLTPVLLSVPLGAILADMLEANKSKIFFYMFVSFTSWSALVYVLYITLGDSFKTFIEVYLQ